MGSKTISLEDSAYQKLKAAKRPDESFSDVIHRLFGRKEPSLTEFSKLLPKESAEEVAQTIRQMRKEDLKIQRRRAAR